MAGLHFNIDRCDPTVVSGWVDRDGPVTSLIVKINNRQICDLSPTSYRPDLVENGFGDGKRGFAFPLSGYLAEGLNRIAISADGEEMFAGALVHQSNPASADWGALADDRAVIDYSQNRWKGDEPAEGLTWGRRMTGDTLWKAYREVRTFVGTENILEIGPGYGRMIETASKQKIPFTSYTGLELSAARTASLRTRFKQRGVQFQTGDANDWRDTKTFDVAIAATTFDFLFPDCGKALKNLRSQMSVGAHVFADFIPATESTASFEPDGTFIRCYREEELRTIFAACGFTVQKIVKCVIGEGAGGKVERTLVVAQAAGAKKAARRADKA